MTALVMLCIVAVRRALRSPCSVVQHRSPASAEVPGAPRVHAMARHR
eukprot:CAMPEP_0119415312 /NCGR_PEP_ID=MMETSP1335-20130426/8635_1 /TAXON_ID=259385 /ORGANISM="Chrysoculter rhomboideus, Strain RCC1486" /LENGTH=46 /DNA_ID= /DNA_START= /DNA_END= /DNA_ORIENTATION=